MTQAGYSGTPLARKLGYKSGAVAVLIDAPADYHAWLIGLPPGVSFVDANVSGKADIVHLFAQTRSALEMNLPTAREAIRRDGAIWVSWPKKASKVPTDVTEGVVRGLALATDLVDVKVCAVTEVWAGLKLVVRRSKR